MVGVDLVPVMLHDKCMFYCYSTFHKKKQKAQNVISPQLGRFPTPFHLFQVSFLWFPAQTSSAVCRTLRSRGPFLQPPGRMVSTWQRSRKFSEVMHCLPLFLATAFLRISFRHDHYSVREFIDHLPFFLFCLSTWLYQLCFNCISMNALYQALDKISIQVKSHSVFLTFS